ncbi:MAG: GTP-binding protein [Thermoplasmata archaeon]|nr:GTP-binding protein [Thermoplasmata archaeon]
MVSKEPRKAYIEISLLTEDPRLQSTRKALEGDGWLLSDDKMLLPLPVKDMVRGKQESMVPIRKILNRAKHLLEVSNVRYEIDLVTPPHIRHRRSNPSRVKVKVILVGNAVVGKTSLARRFVLDQYDDRYVGTVGAKVTKKEIPLSLSDGTPLLVDMSIWDVMGSRSMVSLCRGPYFVGAQGILAVCDLTNENSLKSLEGWIHGAFHVAGKVPVHVLANKLDLEDEKAIAKSDAARFGKGFGAPFLLTSAKSGLNVERAFVDLARRIVGNRFERREELLIREGIS